MGGTILDRWSAIKGRSIAPGARKSKPLQRVETYCAPAAQRHPVVPDIVLPSTFAGVGRPPIIGDTGMAVFDSAEQGSAAGRSVI
ncbi:MAG TPA: hypothetical protein VG742_02185 [Dongiaceae bacterium]|nr:hypothetical protein [Dongiaceae bacterium]